MRRLEYVRPGELRWAEVPEARVLPPACLRGVGDAALGGARPGLDVILAVARLSHDCHGFCAPPEVLALVADGTVDPAPIFSDEIAWEDAPAALAELPRKPHVLRSGRS